MQEPKERMAGLLGEGIGSALPTVIAGKAPQIANGLLQMERNAMAPRTLNPQTGAIVWHGSPHKFDKFDSSKIGTGEGAQAYGHGLYLAESPDVANGYKSTLSGLDQLTPEGRAARYMDRANGDTQRAMRLAWDDYNASADSPTMMNAAYAAIEKLQSGKTPSPSLYKVDLPDEAIAKMLDWDKPMSEQPHVLKALGRLGIPASPTLTGEELIKGSLLKGLSNYDGIVIRGEEALRSKGIPGIRYLDGGSRGAGAGTSNFVVFPGNEGLLKILERNGQGLLGN
jgi:hypothetical protein